MAEERVQRRLAAILAANVVGFCELLAIGEAAPNFLRDVNHFDGDWN